MVKLETDRKIGYDFSKSAKWNINKGLETLKKNYNIKDKKQALLIIEKELNVRAIQYKNTNPDLSLKVKKILEKVKEMYKITKRLELNKDLKSGKKKVKIEGNKFHILSV